LFFAYEDAWAGFEELSARYLADERRGWSVLSFRELPDRDSGILEFASPRRTPVRFLVEKIGRVGKALAFRAFSTVSGSVRTSTLESFVDFARGYWFPRLSYRFMDDLTGLLKEAFPRASVDMTEYVANVFERQEAGEFSKQQTIRTWVQREGDREYDLYRDLNLRIGRIVTLSGARFNITLPDERQKVDVRVDHKCRALLSTRQLDEFKVVLDLVYKEARKELQNYQVKKRIRAREGRSDFGETVSFVEYAGTEILPLRIVDPTSDWFEALSAVLSDPSYLTDNERVVPFVLTEESNPLIQAQLVDLEAQASFTLTALKHERRIEIAPEGTEAHGASIGKIVNILEKIAGAMSVQL